ncbi:hypothetical protein P8C59_000900 [Phyllachora maydis]|uniref:Uncharacterized protein n=1 Tax=Phyllachora maydis TaxID=1825666 RepID=A0AAD9M9H3_9PEZI|nr:hypothetical protein P8C59_000900 [Phyllachora maydis]
MAAATPESPFTTFNSSTLNSFRFVIGIADPGSLSMLAACPSGCIAQTKLLLLGARPRAFKQQLSGQFHFVDAIKSEH